MVNEQRHFPEGDIIDSLGARPARTDEINHIRRDLLFVKPSTMIAN